MGHFPLLRSEDIVRDAVSGLPVDVTADATAIDQAIEDLTSVVQTYLHRILSVRKTVQILAWDRWGWVIGWNYSEAYLTHYPLVQIISVEDQDGTDVTDQYELHDLEEKQERMIKGPSSYSNVRVTAFTGYRRSDQTLANLQAINTELADLTSLPDALPDDIRSVLTECVLNRLILAANGQMGIDQKVAGVGQEDVELFAPDRRFIDSKLVRLVDYIRRN